LRDPAFPEPRVLEDCVVASDIIHQLKLSRKKLWDLSVEATPELLLPLAKLGSRSVAVFPVLLEERLVAAVLCGHASAMSEEDLSDTRQIADRLAVGFSNMALIEALEQLNWGTLAALARAIDAKSRWTAGHSERVTRLALRIGRAMNLSAHDLQVMQRGGLLHDIGKIGTPIEILDKPDKLEPHEMEIMRDHVQTGVRILEPIAAFAESLPIVAQHHEWVNGRGYPKGLAGEEITLHARIFAVADCYDALVSDRPYRAGLAHQRVVQMLAEKAGTQFDPKVIKVFVRMFADEDAGEHGAKSPSLLEQTV
jgi:putative nucleotidyltransferase with HDIG domain